jgi:hypothetical protein
MPANIPFTTYIGFGIGSVATGIMYRRKIVRLRNRLQHMWVDFMIDQRPPQKTEDSIELFFDEKDRQFKPLGIAEEDTNSIIPLVDSIQVVGSTPTASINKRDFLN